ncbi:MAG: prolipoprotein diacylglyceryl transferase [Lachnospiraceae bacterium]
MHPYIEILGKTYPAYGFFMAAGAIAAVFIAAFLTRRKYGFGFVDYVFNLVCIFLASIIGAKLLYLIVEIREFIADPSLFIKFLGGGGIFYGGLIGAIAGTLISARIRRWNCLAIMDTLVAPICFAHAIGRIGCFMAGCCHGRETDSVLGVVFPEGSLAPAGVRLLPTQLMEAVFLVILGTVLLLVIWKTNRPGLSVGIYLIGYSVWRFIIEFYRADRRGSVGALTTSQFIGIFLFITGLAVIIFHKKLYALCGKITKKIKNDVESEKI